ncbi:anti-sigma factor family protein [Tunturibacter empetritectus]|uniref:Anti-sigma factor RsiW n=1 Tax=Tunturiibacter empetritectus TaxID=3069691 RepID=A0A7W8II89_9BACT|nr:zf-HC2 domain-containing protein [Edaphobacter lichenicola]MBB5317641.1 anti-sigma factor RsiW [Edaphobacter lichenicola]
MNQTPQITEHLNSYTLNAFIDGELPPTERQGMEQHLTTCHACTLRVLSATQLKAATARAGHRFAPPPEALGRLAAQLRSQSRLQTKPQTQTNPQPQTPARLYSIRSAAWAALAAAILLTISLLSWRQFHQTNILAAELLDQHLATLSTAATPQVISTDRHTVKPWFQGRLPFSFNLPDVAALPPDTSLKGADLTYLNGQPAALLLFTIHKHEVSIFLTQRSTNPTLSTLSGARAGFTIHTAATPDLRIIAVSDVNPADLDNLVTSLVQAQASLQISK